MCQRHVGERTESALLRAKHAEAEAWMDGVQVLLCASGWLGWHGIPHEKQQPLSRPRHGEERQKSFGFVEGTQCVVEESKPKDISKVQFVDSIFIWRLCGLC